MHISRISTLLQLGLPNVITVFLYRSAGRLGMFKRLMPPGRGYQEPLFTFSPQPKLKTTSEVSKACTLRYAQEQGKTSGTFGTFGMYSFNGNKIITTSGEICELTQKCLDNTSGSP